jgi:hypothetical protein
MQNNEPAWDLLRDYAPDLRWVGWRAAKADKQHGRACVLCREEDFVTALVTQDHYGYVVTTYSGRWCTDEAQFSDVRLVTTKAEAVGILIQAADILDHRPAEDL